jgi:hypothetical protein
LSHTSSRCRKELCTHCRIGCCNDSVCDACNNCGLPFCRRCYRSHHPCRLDVLVNYRPDLKCRHCNRPYDIGTGTSMTHCRRCLKPCCISVEPCKSQVYTAHCGCHGDMCGDCAYWRSFPRSDTLHIFDTGALVPGFMFEAIVPRPGPRRYVCRRCFPTAPRRSALGTGGTSTALR